MTMPTDTEEALTPTDKAALTLAIEVTRRESPARRQQIDNFLATREWIYVATFCAGCAQSRSLNLPPWQPSPCFVGDMAAALNNTDQQSGYRAAALLRQRMERCGVSRWHPDPARECDRIEAERRQTAK